MKNRLKLKFDIETVEGRLEFLNSYLPTLDFVPTEHELKTATDYIFYGKDADGKNRSADDIELKKWASKSVDSIEEILERPAYHEYGFKSPYDIENRKVSTRQVFNRDEARAKCGHLIDTFEDLWARIDRIDFLVESYDLAHGKRDKPIRDELINRVKELGLDLSTLEAKAQSLTQQEYLKLKHLLVELRKEQYNIKDSYSSQVMPAAIETDYNYSMYSCGLPNFGSVVLSEDVKFLPLGLKTSSPLSQKVFAATPSPSDFTEKELQQITNLLYDKSTKPYVIDLTNPDHFYECLRARVDLAESQDVTSFFNDCIELVETINYYVEFAHLTDIQYDILQMRLSGKSNNIIADYINEKYDKSYSQNYISTIIYNRILPSICEGVTAHKELIENIFYPENFKVCLDCGKTLYMSEYNFNRLKKSSNGFMPRCRECTKKKRQRGPVYEIKYKHE